MAYTFITQYDSPNYTPASQTRATWGRDRNIQEIVIHWWDDPSKNPSFEGVIATLTNPARQASAHFVATGTGRRVACLVAPEDNAWASNNDNPISIAIECDPRCRDEDYDVVGELVAELRATYGNLPLKRHQDCAGASTSCPGNWNLDRINQVASTKIAKATDQFGLAVTKTVTPTITVDEIKQLYLDVLERPADDGGIQTYLKSGMNAGGVRNALLASPEYKDLQARKAKAQADAIAQAQKDAATKAAQEAAAQAAKDNDQKGGYTQADRDRDNQVASVVQWIKDFLSRIFK